MMTIIRSVIELAIIGYLIYLSIYDIRHHKVTNDSVLLYIPIVTLNTFAFGIRCAGPFAAYGLGMVVEKCTKNAGILSIITGTIGFIFWQILSGGGFLFGILPVVFGCAIGAATFFIVNAVELKAGKPIAPSAFLEN